MLFVPKDGCLVLVATLPPISIGIGAGVFGIGILGRLIVLRHRHTTNQTESNDPGGSRLDWPHGSDLG